MGGWNEYDLQVCPADKLMAIMEMMGEGSDK